MGMSAYVLGKPSTGYIVHTLQRKAYQSVQQKEWTQEEDSVLWTMRPFLSGSINANKERTILCSILLGVGGLLSSHVYGTSTTLSSIRPLKVLLKILLFGSREATMFGSYSSLVCPCLFSKHGFVVALFG